MSEQRKVIERVEKAYIDVGAAAGLLVLGKEIDSLSYDFDQMADGINEYTTKTHKLAGELDSLRNHCEKSIVERLDEADRVVGELRAEANEREKRISRMEEQLSLLQSMHAGHEPAAYHHSDTGA